MRATVWLLEGCMACFLICQKFCCSRGVFASVPFSWSQHAQIGVALFESINVNFTFSG